MKSKKTKFSWASYSYERRNSLSFIGLNRYEDWLILLMLFTILIISAIGWGYYVYQKGVIEPEMTHDTSLTLQFKEVDIKSRVEAAFMNNYKASTSPSLYIDPSVSRR